VRNGESPVDKPETPKSWPLTLVAVLYVLQGLWACYSAFVVTAIYGASIVGTLIGLAVLDAIFGVMLTVAGIGLLARIKAYLTVAVVLAAVYLAGTGASLIEVCIQGAPPLIIAANVAFVALGCVQYVILRSKSTTALFATPNL
jgi:hypothetical protein